MKKVNVLLLAALLLLGGGFAACDNSNDDPLAEMFPDGIKPVILEGKLGKELTDFFNENAGRIVGSIFPFPDAADPHHEQEMWFLTDTCLMINSMEEFPTVDFRGESIEVPAIDFDTYTLVIGKYYDPHAPLMAQRVVVESEDITVNLLFKYNGDQTDDLRIGKFWGIYSKLPDVPIRVVRHFQ